MLFRSAAACVVGLALVGLGAWRLWSPTDERTPRVQVLNFRDAGGGEHTAELASYLVADIAGVLAQSGIKTVASRPSGEADVDRRKADLQIGGVVRADGARLKVRVFLNDPRADIVLWSTSSTVLPPRSNSSGPGQLRHSRDHAYGHGTAAAKGSETRS